MWYYILFCFCNFDGSKVLYISIYIIAYLLANIALLAGELNPN